MLNQTLTLRIPTHMQIVSATKECIENILYEAYYNQIGKRGNSNKAI